MVRSSRSPAPGLSGRSARCNVNASNRSEAAAAASFFGRTPQTFSFARSRSTNFWILPVEVFGMSPNSTVRGTLKRARCWRQRQQDDPTRCWREEDSNPLSPVRGLRLSKRAADRFYTPGCYGGASRVSAKCSARFVCTGTGRSSTPHMRALGSIGILLPMPVDAKRRARLRNREARNARSKARKSSWQRTRWWREKDSNPRSPVIQTMFSRMPSRPHSTDSYLVRFAP
jgi:hypothetical protein